MARQALVCVSGRGFVHVEDLVAGVREDGIDVIREFTDPVAPVEADFDTVVGSLALVDVRVRKDTEILRDVGFREDVVTPVVEHVDRSVQPVGEETAVDSDIRTQEFFPRRVGIGDIVLVEHAVRGGSFPAEMGTDGFALVVLLVHEIVGGRFQVGHSDQSYRSPHFQIVDPTGLFQEVFIGSHPCQRKGGKPSDVVLRGVGRHAVDGVPDLCKIPRIVVVAEVSGESAGVGRHLGPLDGVFVAVVPE